VTCMLYGVAFSVEGPAYLTITDSGRCGGDVGHHRDDLLPRAVRRRAGGRVVMCQEFHRAGCRRKAACRGARSLRPWKVGNQGLTLPAVATASQTPHRRAGVGGRLGRPPHRHGRKPGSGAPTVHKQVLVFRAVCGRGGQLVISLTLQASVLTNHPRLSTGDHLRHAAAQPGSTKTAIQPRGPPIYSPICSPVLTLRALYSPVR